MAEKEKTKTKYEHMQSLAACFTYLAMLLSNVSSLAGQSCAQRGSYIGIQVYMYT